MSISFSWVELHGALTHFPIVFLLSSVACDLSAVLFRHPEWRSIAQGLLIAAVVTSVPALLTGYMTGRGFPYPPVGFSLHWMAAVTTSILSLVLLVWRLSVRDRLGVIARYGALSMSFVCAAAVSLTGYMGGQMVFASPLPTSPPLELASVNLAAKGKPASKLAKQGDVLFHSTNMGCISCHSVGGTGGAIGPDLTHEGSRGHNAAWQMAHLKSPSSKVPGSRMPPYNTIKPSDLNAIVAYLNSLK